MVTPSLQPPHDDTENEFLYMLVPLHALPCVDLSISVKTRLRSKLVNQFVRVVAVSSLTYIGFMACIVMATLVFVVPVHAGQILAVLAFVLGLPATLLTGVMLRYELAHVLIKTYDIWFFGVTSLLATTLLGGLLRNWRGIFVGTISWLAFLLNIFIDANLFGLRQAWIANIFSTSFYAFVIISISVGLTQGIEDFAVLSMNGHSLPASGLV